MYPTNLRYTKDHEWILVEGAIGTVGITDFAQAQLGDIVYVELPAVGRVIAQHEVVGTIESVKAVSEIYSPVSGEVVEANAGLNDTPDVVNKDPHGAAWLFKVRLAAPAEIDGLMDAATYGAHAK
jgi:glycine cleavage system H protein